MFNVQIERQQICGPFAQSNWVIPSLVLCGPQPDPRQKKQFDALLGVNIQVFVSLLEFQPDYVSSYEAAVGHRVLLLHYPMKDGDPVVANQIEEFLATINRIIDIIKSGMRIYIHCHSGHGRTGLVVSALLGILFNLPGMKAVNLCDSLHSCRADTEDQSSPQTQEQRLSIVSLLTNFKR
jgi:protein tyrosine phosphatase